MSKLTIDQKTIKDLFSAKKTNFLIPDYQRPYAWTDVECGTLWDDIFAFAFPDNDYSKFDSDNDEYFLGPIVTYNNNEKLEVIDGQQRLTTLMLLLRAFYDKFANMMDPNSQKTREAISKCIWKTDEFGTPITSELKIDSEVATDNEKDEFISILKTGVAPMDKKSKYAANFRFFVNRINDFLSTYPGYFSYLPNRILNNCILLPIEAESQDTALRIFSTLNDRGLPLSDSDIFKAQFYKYYSKKGEKDAFIKKWKALEEITEKIFHPANGTPMDELFTRYMYFERAKLGIDSSTTEALRKFYERDSYALLNNDYTLENLIILAKFWEDVASQNEDRFSERVLRRLFVLNYAPNGMWTYFTSVYFMQNKDPKGLLEDEAFYSFLNKITAFIWTYAITNPGVNALRTPVYADMVNIVNDAPLDFKGIRFTKETLKSNIDNFQFYNARPITKSMVTWWALQNDNQELLSLDTVLEIEHIYARNRNEKEHTLSKASYVDKLGNKALLEKRINIRASDYRFSDKINYYRGYVNRRGQKKDATKIIELLSLASTSIDFTESDILNRDKEMIAAFIEFVSSNGLIKNA